MPRLTDRHGRPVSGQMPGLVEALVVDNIDPKRLGRVKVKFPSLPDMPESFWARLMMPMAGTRRGWMTIPEKDDEVLVATVGVHLGESGRSQGAVGGKGPRAGAGWGEIEGCGGAA